MSDDECALMHEAAKALFLLMSNAKRTRVLRTRQEVLLPVSYDDFLVAVDVYPRLLKFALSRIEADRARAANAHQTPGK